MSEAWKSLTDDDPTEVEIQAADSLFRLASESHAGSLSAIGRDGGDHILEVKALAKIGRKWVAHFYREGREIWLTRVG